MRIWLLLLVIVTSCFIAPRPASAAAEVPTYVSQQFRVVAKRTIQQVTAEAIARACPPDQPLCDQVLQRIGEAFSAAVAKDDVALRAALNDFFIDSSVSGLLQSSVAEALTDDAFAGEIGKGLHPLLRCLAATLSGRAARVECTISEIDRGYMTSMFNALYGAGGPAITATIHDAWSRVYSRKKLSADDVLFVLQNVLGSAPVQRPDLAIYVNGLRSWVGLGLGHGLVAPTYDLLSNLRPSGMGRSVLTFGEPGAPAVGLWSPAVLAAWKAAIVACNLDPAPLDAWTNSRLGVLPQIRAELLTARLASTSALDKLLQIPATCTNAANLVQIKQMRRQVRYLLGAIHMAEAGTSYGVAGLAAAGVIDFVRDSSTKGVEQSLPRLFIYGLAPAVLNAVNKPLAALPVAAGPTINFRTVRDVLRSCEFREAEAAFNLKAPTDAPGDICLGKCLPLAQAGASPTTCKNLPQGDRREVTPESFRSLVAIAKTWILKQNLVLDNFSMEQLATLERGLEQLQAGDDEGAKKTLLRLGIDQLVARVDAMSTKLLGVSETTCESAVRERWITGMGGACAAHVLIQSAYHPIADYYWEHGISEKDVPTVAKSVYKEIIANPYLDYTPLILNLGLGATYVRGSEDVFGEHGYSALTLLDKFGLAIYKYNGPTNRFEAGVFAGGFVDALIRTAADEGKKERYWILGGTVGWPRLFNLDLGFEAHIGAAMPFDFSTKHYGFAAGGALVVPFNYLLDDEGT